MIRLKSIIKIIQFFLLLLLVLQTSSLYVTANPDKPVIAHSHNNNYLLLNLGYISQRDLNIPAEENLSQPYFNTGVSFYTKKNFDISVQGGMAMNSDTSFTKSSGELEFNMGYSVDVSPTIKIRSSYSHWIYSKNSNELQSLFSDMGQIDIYIQKKWYLGGLFSSYMFGDRNTFYGTIKNGVNYYYEGVFGKASLLSFGLEMDLNLNDNNYFNMLIYESWDALEFEDWATGFFGESQDISARIEREGFENVRSSIAEQLVEDDPTIFKPSYIFTTLNIGVPVLFVSNTLSCFLLPMFVVPLSSSLFYEKDVQFIFSAGLAITLSSQY